MFRVGTLLGLLLLTALLAGCSDDSAKASADDEFDEIPEFEDVDVTDETGAIRGIVVDEAIVPVAGVTIKLSPSGLETESGESGAFVFEDLEEGTYFIKASKPGYFDAQASVDVVAGVKEPEIKRLMLEVNAATQPFTEMQVWEGFLQCGVTITVAIPVGFNACGLIDEDFITWFTLSRGIPDLAQAEMIWESTQALSPELSLGYYVDGTTTNWKSIQGPSPIVLPATKEEMVAGIVGGANATENPMRVFPPYSSPAGVGMTLNQDFTVYMTYFYGFLPREGWTFVNDGPCGAPEECGAA